MRRLFVEYFEGVGRVADNLFGGGMAKAIGRFEANCPYRLRRVSGRLPLLEAAVVLVMPESESCSLPEVPS